MLTPHADAVARPAAIKVFVAIAPPRPAGRPRFALDDLVGHVIDAVVITMA